MVDSTTSVEDLSGELEDAHERIRGLEADLVESQSQVAGLTEERDGFRTRCDELDGIAMDLRDSLQVTLDRLGELERDVCHRARKVLEEARRVI